MLKKDQQSVLYALVGLLNGFPGEGMVCRLK